MSAGLADDALTAANRGRGGDKRVATAPESSTREGDAQQQAAPWDMLLLQCSHVRNRRMLIS